MDPLRALREIGIASLSAPGLASAGHLDSQAMSIHSAVEPDLRWNLGYPRAPKIRDDRALEIAYSIAEVVMDVAGPLFWAVLVLALMASMFGIDSFH
jgi:hypothetical protein